MPVPVSLVDLEARAAYAPRDSDISNTLRRVMEAINGMPARQMADWELVEHVREFVDANEEVAACILRLKEMGCIIEPRAGVL